MITILLFLLSILVPAQVDETSAEQWFDTAGTDTARSGAVSSLPDLTNERREQLTLSEPFPVGRVTDEGLVEPNTESHLWMAIVLLEGEPLATLLADFSAEPAATSMESDSFLVSTASALGGPDTLYFDEELTAYFAVIDGEIGPASEVALDYLAGPVSPSQFTELRKNLVVAGVPTTPALTGADKDDINPVVVVLLLLGAAFTLVLLVTWYRASGDSEADEENRDEDDTPTIRRKVRFYRRGEPNVDVSD